MTIQSSGIPTPNEPDPFDGGCPADTQQWSPTTHFKNVVEVTTDLHAQLARAEKENSRLLRKNQLLLKAIADISRELDDLTHRCGLIATGATTN